MKTIENKTVPGVTEPAIYTDLIRMCANNPPQNGLDVETMRKRIRIIDAAEGAKDSFELEDADLVELKSCVNAMRWAIPHVSLIGFVDYINSVE